MSAAPQIDYPRRLASGDGIQIEFETISTTGAHGLHCAKLRAFYEIQPGFYELVYAQGDDVVFIAVKGDALTAVTSSGGIQIPIKRLDLITIVEDLRMMLRKRRAQMPEAVEAINALWELATSPEAPAGLEERHEPLELIAVVEAPTEYGPYMVNKLTLDGEDLEELLIEHGGRELSITRTESGYACEWSDDWSPAPKAVAISLLLNLGEHTPDDEVAIACDAAAGMIGAAPTLEELRAFESAAIEAGRGSQLEPALAAEAIALFSGEQASIIDTPTEAAPPSGNELRKLPMQYVTRDPRCQTRTGLDDETVARYASLLRDGVTLPPIMIIANPDGPERWLVDGWHRYEAHRKIGAVAIPALISQGTLRDAIYAACSANATHGKQRTREDLWIAIDRLLDDPEWSDMGDRALGRHVGCDGKTIAAGRKRRAEREQEDQEALPKKPSAPQEVLAPSAEIRTPAETTRHETIERTTTTSTPERCERTLDLVEMLGAPSTQAEVIEASMVDAPTDEPSSDERYTPRDVIELARTILGGIGLDPASCAEAQEVVKAKVFWTSAHDALARDWGAVGARTVWLNPPYSRALIGPFAQKFLEELEASSFEEALVLVNASVCATWWQDLARRAQLIAYPPSRLAFRQPGTGEQRGNLYDSSMMFFGAPEDAPHVRATLRSCDWLVTSGGGA